MPKGPKGEKRPADVVGNAVKVMRAIDSLAGQITGNSQCFWMGRASAGGNETAFERGM